MPSIQSRFIDALGILALVFIAAIAGLTTADVVLRNTVGGSISGLVDLTQFGVMHAVFLSIAYGFARRSHVAVTVVTDMLSGRANRSLATLWWLLSIAMLAVMCYAAFEQAQLVLRYGDVSQNLEIPMILYWVPVVGGFALMVLGAALAARDEWSGGRRGRGQGGQ